MNNSASNTLKYISVFLVLVSVLLSACQSRQTLSPRSLTKSPGIQAETVVNKELVSINSILVVPPEGATHFAQRSKVDPQLLSHELYQDLMQALQAESDIQLFGGEQHRARVSLQGPTRNQRLRQQAQALKADAVLFTTFNSYVDRKGSELGVTVPAAVDFEMDLVRALDGKSIWSASYHFQDQALSENLLAMNATRKTRAGEGWISARDAVQFGFAAASKELATARLSAFSTKTP